MITVLILKDRPRTRSHVSCMSKLMENNQQWIRIIGHNCLHISRRTSAKVRVILPDM